MQEIREINKKQGAILEEYYNRLLIVCAYIMNKTAPKNPNKTKQEEIKIKTANQPSSTTIEKYNKEIGKIKDHNRYQTILKILSFLGLLLIVFTAVIQSLNIENTEYKDKIINIISLSIMFLYQSMIAISMFFLKKLNYKIFIPQIYITEKEEDLIINKNNKQ